MTIEALVWVLLVVVVFVAVVLTSKEWLSDGSFTDAQGNMKSFSVDAESYVVMLGSFYVGLAVVPLAGLVSYSGVAAVRFTASSIAHSYCMAQEPILQSVWEAALQGNSDAVQQMLRQVDVTADTAHHISKTHLVLEVAGVRASTEEQDAQLSEVLRVLHSMGWSLAMKDSKRQQNALHVLVQHHKCYNVMHRVNFLIESELAAPKPKNLLSDGDWAGKIPQQRVAHSRWSLAAMLRAKRLLIEQAADDGAVASTGSSVAFASPKGAMCFP